MFEAGLCLLDTCRAFVSTFPYAGQLVRDNACCVRRLSHRFGRAEDVLTCIAQYMESFTSSCCVVALLRISVRCAC